MSARIIVIVALALCSCHPCGVRPSIDHPAKTAQAYTIMWTGYDGYSNPDDAVYYLNERKIGAGRKGFEAILKALETVGKGSIVVVRPEDTSRLNGPMGPGYRVPFRNQYDQLLDLVERRQLVLKRPGGGLFGEEDYPPPSPRKAPATRTPS